MFRAHPVAVVAIFVEKRKCKNVSVCSQYTLLHDLSWLVFATLTLASISNFNESSTHPEKDINQHIPEGITELL